MIGTILTVNEYQLKLEKVKLMEEQLRIHKALPHLYGYKMYPWMRTFYESTNKHAFICSANQIGKSSIQIRKLIHWATSPQLQGKLWPHLVPRQFWYLYPSNYVATIEFEKKWAPEFLPRDSMKNHAQFGWRPDYRQKYIQALHFNTGISVYFKTYQQDPQDLQAGTCSAIFTDEELPEELFPELQMRLAATDGYFHAVFTPTLGQEFWRRVIEGKGKERLLSEALVLQVSMYDCMLYEDGTASFWSSDRIQKIINSCKSETEVQRRVYGRFVLDTGLKYQAFQPTVNLIEPMDIPSDWPVYIGVDSGSGGKYSHPSAVTFVAMKPDYSYGVAFKGRRFDGLQTTNSDLVAIVREMKKDITNQVVGVYYDYSATDLRAIAYEMGETWIPAEKSHLIGEQYMNVAFKNKMLQIFNTDEFSPLVSELKSLKISTPKNQAHDDFCDSLRYAITKIPWDWSKISDKPRTTPRQSPPTEIEERRKFLLDQEEIDHQDIDAEINAWNELFENDFAY